MKHPGLVFDLSTNSTGRDLTGARIKSRFYPKLEPRIIIYKDLEMHKASPFIIMKQNTSFIQFNEKNSTVELTLSFRVNEAQDTQFIPKHELTFHSFSEILLDALEQRMKHCKDILTTEILPAKDKVFTPYMIFSNEVGKHFSIKAYQAMTDAAENLKSYGFTGEYIPSFLKQLTRLQAQQCLKALATMQTDVREELLQECVDAVAEAALCNVDAENPFAESPSAENPFIV